MFPYKFTDISIHFKTSLNLSKPLLTDIVTTPDHLHHIEFDEFRFPYKFNLNVNSVNQIDSKADASTTLSALELVNVTLVRCTTQSRNSETTLFDKR